MGRQVGSKNFSSVDKVMRLLTEKEALETRLAEREKELASVKEHSCNQKVIDGLQKQLADANQNQKLLDLSGETNCCMECERRVNPAKWIPCPSELLK